MANKVIERVNGVDTVILDVSQTTATETDVAVGKIFTKQDGTQGTGTLVPGSDGTTMNAASDSAMESLLVESNIGKVVTYTGTDTESYESGELYLVVADDSTL